MSTLARGTRAWLASGLCALAVCASLVTLTGPIVAGSWVPASIAAIVALFALLALVRSVTTAWWPPTLIGLVVVGLGMLATFASPPGRFQALPTTDSVARLGDAIRAGLAYADASRPPVDATRPLELLVVGGALLVVLITDLLALGLSAPAWSALPMLALWLPGIALGRETSAWLFIAAGGAYLMLLALTAAPAPAAASASSRGRADGSRRTTVAALGTIAVTVAAIVLAPVAGSVPGWSSLRFPEFGAGEARSLQLAQDLDMRESLGSRSSEVVLTYAADPVTVGPLRLFTLRDFDGDNWSRDDRASTLAADSRVLWPARDLDNRPAGEIDPTLSTVTVRVDGLREERLPVPVMPRTIDAGGRWSYDAERDEVDRVGSTREGMEYTMKVELLDITAASLSATQSPYPGDMSQYLAVPTTSHAADIAAAAGDVTRGAAGPYAQALALQSYFRDTQNFTYSTQVPAAVTDDAVWDFLGSKTGYCVQFATAMTIMARSVGIPARLGVGYLPGTLNDSGEHVVTGKDSHAWPELYFPSSGWVRFEPTPAIQSGAPPRWADPFAQSGAAPTIDANPRGATTAPSRAPNAQESNGQATTTQSTPSGLLIGAGGSLVLLVLAGAAWWVRRRRTVRPGDLSPEVTWAHLRSRLAAEGFTWSQASTPRQVPGLLDADVELRTGTPLSPAARAALDELAHALETERYSPHPRAWEAGELEALVAVVLRGVTKPGQNRPTPTRGPTSPLNPS